MEEDFEKIGEKTVDISWSAGYEADVWKSKEPFLEKVTLGHSEWPTAMYYGVALEAADLAVLSEGKLATTWGHLKQIQ